MAKTNAEHQAEHRRRRASFVAAIEQALTRRDPAEMARLRKRHLGPGAVAPLRKESSGPRRVEVLRKAPLVPEPEATTDDQFRDARRCLDAAEALFIELLDAGQISAAELTAWEGRLIAARKRVKDHAKVTRRRLDLLKPKAG